MCTMGGCVTLAPPTADYGTDTSLQLHVYLWVGVLHLLLPLQTMEEQLSDLVKDKAKIEARVGVQLQQNWRSVVMV